MTCGSVDNNNNYNNNAFIMRHLSSVQDLFRGAEQKTKHFMQQKRTIKYKDNYTLVHIISPQYYK